MKSRHLEDHPEYVEGCFGCKVASLQINTGAAKAANN